MGGSVLGRLFGGLLKPESASPAVVSVLVLTPPVVAGIVLFRRPALEMLGIALGLGAAVHLACRIFRQPVPRSPALAALIGVALVGPGAPPVVAGGVAAVAALGEVARVRLLPRARVETGLAGYALILLVLRGLPAAYLQPGTATAASEPVRLWLESHAASGTVATQLYLGAVPGPVFATSLLAVCLAAAGLWYARRLSLPVLVAFGLGALAPVLHQRWTPALQLASGPLWFSALVLADRQEHAFSRLLGPVLALAAGAGALAARRLGYSIEAVPVVVVAAQLLWSGLEGVAAWLVWVVHRRAAQRADRAVQAQVAAEPSPAPAPLWALPPAPPAAPLLAPALVRPRPAPAAVPARPGLGSPGHPPPAWPPAQRQAPPLRRP